MFANIQNQKCVGISKYYGINKTQMVPFLQNSFILTGHAIESRRVSVNKLFHKILKSFVERF